MAEACSQHLPGRLHSSILLLSLLSSVTSIFVPSPPPPPPSPPGIGCSGEQVFYSTTGTVSVSFAARELRCAFALHTSAPGVTLSFSNLALAGPGGACLPDDAHLRVYDGTTTFDRMLPVLTTLGRRVLHTGPIGSASVLKVMTNYLATANLLTLCEALTTMKMAGIDLNTTYEAIRISSGNSFVHETESQVILNGSRDISFTLDLVLKDIGLFQEIAECNNVPLEISPLMIKIFKDGQDRYGPRAWSDDIIRRLEEACDTEILAPGFPAKMIDDEPEEPGYEVVPKGKD